MPQLEVSARVKADISNAVNAGRTATVPKQSLIHGGYKGAGYILQDPETGAAGYWIDGGGNGGFELACESAAEPVVAAVSAAVQAAAAAMSNDKATTAVSVAVIAGAIVITIGVVALLPAIAPYMAFVRVTIALVSVMAAQQARAKGVVEEDDCERCRKRKNYCITFCQYELDVPGRTDNTGPFRACIRRCMNDAGCDY